MLFLQNTLEIQQTLMHQQRSFFFLFLHPQTRLTPIQHVQCCFKVFLENASAASNRKKHLVLCFFVFLTKSAIRSHYTSNIKCIQASDNSRKRVNKKERKTQT